MAQGLAAYCGCQRGKSQKLTCICVRVVITTINTKMKPNSRIRKVLIWIHCAPVREIGVLICEEYTQNYWRTMTLVGVACIQVNCLQFPGKASSVQCEVDQLSAGQNCANT